MDLRTFETEVRQTLDEARTSLGRIEMVVREEGETPALMEASRIYARFCMHARDYITGSTLGRPLPRRFAERLEELRNHLAVHDAILVPYGLRPDVARLGELLAAAQALPERVPS